MRDIELKANSSRFFFSPGRCRMVKVKNLNTLSGSSWESHCTLEFFEAPQNIRQFGLLSLEVSLAWDINDILREFIFINKIELDMTPAEIVPPDDDDNMTVTYWCSRFNRDLHVIETRSWAEFRLVNRIPADAEIPPTSGEALQHNRNFIQKIYPMYLLNSDGSLLVIIGHFSAHSSHIIIDVHKASLLPFNELKKAIHYIPVKDEPLAWRFSDDCQRIEVLCLSLDKEDIPKIEKLGFLDCWIPPDTNEKYIKKFYESDMLVVHKYNVESGELLMNHGTFDELLIQARLRYRFPDIIF